MKLLFQKPFTKIVIFALLISGWLYWDFSQADGNQLSQYRSFRMASAIDATTEATVSIVRSDDYELAHQTFVTDENISYETIEDMVRKAIELAGGLDYMIRPGFMVLLKPNIVDPEPPGSGEITDVRVIKALIKIIDDMAPGEIEIVVGEGSPRPMDYELDFQRKYSSPCWDELWDVAGYQDLLTDPHLAGANLRLSNLNGSPPEDPWQDLVEVDVPGGGVADPQYGKYYIHKDVLNADVFITVPVMKIHDPGMTSVLKNQIGLAPSTMYGFSKTAGVDLDNYQHRLIHTSQMPKMWTHKEIVDLCNIANINFTVVDAIMCLDLQKSLMGGNANQVRMNTIVASPDPVAADHVCARLMGLNPDDIEHITLAEQVGLGTNNADNITIKGANLDLTKKLFRKSPASTGDFGQSNRYWLVKGPYSIDGITDPIDHAFLTDEAGITPEEGKDGWSESIYFRDDHIDLKDYFNLSSSDDCVAYTFVYFDAPKDQTAELWIGSDDALKIYINGQEVYKYTGTRSFSGSSFVSAKVNAQIKKGENRLLVKTLQKYSRFDFCLNICEPETNPNYDGNRVWGLKFKTSSSNTPVEENPINLTSSEEFRIHAAYPNPFNGQVTIPYQIDKASHLSISVYDVTGNLVKRLFNGLHSPAGETQINWNATNDQGAAVSSGIYFIRFNAAGTVSQNIKVLYCK